MNNVITFTREELRDVLGVNEGALKQIVKRGQLSNRIEDQGYRLVNSYKVGRNTLYGLILMKVSKEGKAIEDYQRQWKIRKKEEHKEYVIARVCDEKSLKSSRSSILKGNDKLKNISWDTAKRWDEKLEQSKIIKKDGYVYFIRYKNGTREECTREQFSMYWSDNAWVSRALNNENYSFKKGLTSKAAHGEKIYELKSYMNEKYGYIVRNYQSYTEGEKMETFRRALFGESEMNNDESIFSEDICLVG